MTWTPRVATVRLIFLGAFSVALLVLYATAAPAQTQQTKVPGEAAEQMQQMAERLQLTEEQRTAIRPIMLDFAEATHAVFEKYGIDPQSGQRPPLSKVFAIRGDMKANRQQMESRLAMVLTPGQMETFRQLSDEQRKAIRSRVGQTN